MRNQYIVVARDSNENIRIRKTDNFYMACALQMAMLVGADAQTCLPLVKDKPEDIKAILGNLLKDGRDRICNDEEEVYLYFLPGRKQFRERRKQA